MKSLNIKAVQNQKGGVILEFSVIVPVLLLICFGLFDIGQAFSQKAWLESVAFQSVMMGGELQEMRVESMQNVTNELVDVLHDKLDKRFVNPSIANSAKEDETNRTVTAVVPGEMRMISNIVKIPYAVSLTGPILARTSSASAELNPEAKNDKFIYDCFGNPIPETNNYNGKVDCGSDPANNPTCACACAGNGLGSKSKGCY